MNKISIENAINKKNYLFVDVRTPNEYLDGTIPNAINVPIYNNEERALIGYMYTKVSKWQAKEKGLEIASTKLYDIYKTIRSASANFKGVVIFCWRGGMRSGSIVTILNLMGLGNVYQLEGGYKGYRRFILKEFDRWKSNIRFIVLRGNTGVGKTLLLDQLAENNLPVLNLERLANHRGSVFGSIGLDKQPTQKNFEAFIYDTVMPVQNKLIFIESESGKIGSLFVPTFITEKIVNGIHVHVTCNQEIRIQRLLDEYLNAEKHQSINNIFNVLPLLKKYISNTTYATLYEYLANKDFKNAAALLLEQYYDPMYSKWNARYGKFQYKIDSSNIQDAVNQLINIYNQIS
ncbi:MAG: tRNA 2-selenouridine synthase [Clostridiales bacterium]|nr:tRNA 2-selenouridine synthase [Clostridiales bacterium]